MKAVNFENQNMEGEMKDEDKIDIYKRYDITCPYCGKKQQACLSIFQKYGLDDEGRGNCLDCKKPMSLVFDYETETMTAKAVN